MTTLLFGVVGFYILQVGAAAVGFTWVQRQAEPAPPSTWPFASIVVAARNEAETIEACLDSLRACHYPDDRYEIIVVDDFSTDETALHVKAYEHADGPTVRLVSMADHQAGNGAHKPAAVAQGVAAASGDLLLTTDADCVVPEGWLRSMARRCTPDTPFVAGPVTYEHKDRFLPRLQALELTGLVAYGAGTLGLGLPTFCNSANVAYRRAALSAHDGGAAGAAQDELLLQHVAYGSGRAVAFNPDPEATIATEPAASFADYLRQQARWAHMGLRYPFWGPRLLVVGLWLAHAVLLTVGIAALALPPWRPPLLLALLGKMGADVLLTVPASRHFGQRGLLRSLVPTELLLVLVVPVVGLLGTFGSLEWKGRSLE